MDIDLIVKITARAWSLSILALMHRGTPGRQASLLAATGAGRTAFTQSLLHLVDLGLMERNPGHGHPIRPEYRLTAVGIQAAHMADQIKAAVPQTAETTLLRRAWTVPVLAVSGAPQSFTSIKTALGSITDRALSQSLKRLEGQRWLRREFNIDIHPPRARYHALGAGLLISRAVGIVA